MCIIFIPQSYWFRENIKFKCHFNRRFDLLLNEFKQYSNYQYWHYCLREDKKNPFSVFKSSMNLISELNEDSNANKNEPKRRKITQESIPLNQNLNIICRRFPHVSQRILKNLDDQTLKRSNEVSREVVKVLDNERFYWIRIIKSYIEMFKGKKEFWNEVITKIPLNVVKPLALALIQFCSLHSLIANPIFIVAANGNIQLYEYVLKKNKK